MSPFLFTIISCLINIIYIISSGNIRADKMFNMYRLLIFFTTIGIYFSQCNNPTDSNDFSIQEDYFADHLIGFYLNSIDINTGDSNVEYFRTDISLTYILDLI